jgi:prepilin-type N-terminal cleavage/methylation domain-containing protein/prepilin-type processing-associated H-X9-DG protein
MAPTRRGYTVLELLVALAIMGVLMAILLPAVQAARESSRRITCSTNLRQFGVAMSAYHATHGIYPPGGSKGSLFVNMLPHCDATTLYDQFNQSLFHDAPANHTVNITSVRLLCCPSDGAGQRVMVGVGAGTNYAGCFGSGALAHGYNGMFGHLVPMADGDGAVRDRDVIDGLTQTVAISEILPATFGRDMRRGIFFLSDRPMAGTVAELERLAERCRSAERSSLAIWPRGRPWTYGDVGAALYNHATTPNGNSCSIGGAQEGFYAAASDHPGGVQALFGDGSVLFLSDAIAVDVWRALGSRSGGEMIDSHSF